MSDTAISALDALKACDARALRAALVEDALPTRFNGKPLVYAWVEGLAELPDRAAGLGVLEVLLSAGADANEPGSQAARLTPLMEAAAQADLPAMRRLLASGADPHARTGMGATALHWAAAAGTIAGVRLLLEQGLSVDEPTSINESPLHWAAQRVNRPMIRELYHQGADFHLVSTTRLTPLDLIAKSDKRLAEFWRHKPGRDHMERATAPAPNVGPRRSRRL